MSIKLLIHLFIHLLVNSCLFNCLPINLSISTSTHLYSTTHPSLYLSTNAILFIHISLHNTSLAIPFYSTNITPKPKTTRTYRKNNDEAKQNKTMETQQQQTNNEGKERGRERKQEKKTEYVKKSSQRAISQGKSPI